MRAKFVTVDRRTPMLLAQDLREWVPEGDMVHFVIEAIEGMNLSRLKVNHRGSGSDQYPPTMMTCLLVYSYANGIFGSRRIEAATYRDIAVRYLTADTHPDHDTICKFRRDNFDVVSECFFKVLEMAREMKILRVGTVSIDGTHIKANASKDRNVSYERSGELIEQLRQEVSELMKRAENADKDISPTGQELPQEIARREALKAKLEDARMKIEERVKKRAEAERGQYEAKVEDREKRSGRRKGKIIQPPDEEPKASDQGNLTDADSRLMRKNKRSGYSQDYNAQAVVDADGSHLILGARVSQCASDRNELVEDVLCDLGRSSAGARVVKKLSPQSDRLLESRPLSRSSAWSNKPWGSGSFYYEDWRKSAANGNSSAWHTTLSASGISKWPWHEAGAQYTQRQLPSSAPYRK